MKAVHYGRLSLYLDSNGVVVVKYVYDAWGNVEVRKPDGSALTSESHIGNLNPYRYRGYYYDIETELYYLNTRYYDPEVGRFITIDDISYLDPDTINGLNLYAYCANNPVMAIDPDGTKKKWWKWLLGLTIIVAAVALSIVTAGLAAPIATAMGSGLVGSVIGGAVAGAIGGAIASFGFSVGVQGIQNGFSNINWKEVGWSTLSGAVSGAVVGGIFGAINHVGDAAKVAEKISGLKNAQENFNNAATLLENTPMTFKGGVMSTEHIVAQLGYNVASRSVNMAQSVYNVVKTSISIIYKAMQFFAKQILGHFVSGWLK